MFLDEEASELSNLEEKRDKLAREHYIIRKKNMRATAQIDNLQQNFQSYHDKQNQTASEVYKFAEKMRKEHLALKQETSAKIE
jgi:vacuolar-type H+-ATPase subunit I/STV1